MLHEAGARCCLGEIAALRGDLEAATGYLLPALATFIRLGNHAAAAECLVALAVTRDDVESARQLVDAASAARERMGVAPLPVERRLEQRVQERLRAASPTERPAGLSRSSMLRCWRGRDPERI